MDWLLVGDLRGMVRERWRQYGVDPDMPLPALAHRDTRVEALGDQPTSPTGSLPSCASSSGQVLRRV
jgi:hypothetical protein